MTVPRDRAEPSSAKAAKRRANYLSVIAIGQLLSVVLAGYLLMWSLAVTYISYSEAEYFGQGKLWSVESLSTYAIELTLGLGYIVPGLAGATGLLWAKEWGRKLSVVHAVLSLILFPIGTILGALALRYLLQPDVKEHFQAARKRGDMPG